MKLNKLTGLTGIALVLSATTALADFNRGFTQEAAAGGGNDGYIGTAFDGRRTTTFANGQNTLVSRADTNPNYGAAVGTMDLQTGGSGFDNDDLYSQSLLDGDQAVGAQVGRKGILTETGADGEINQGIAGDGDRVSLGGSQLLQSNQTAVAVDTPYGGAGGGEAQVVGSSGLAGEVSGRRSSTLEMSSDMTVSAGVKVTKTNLLNDDD